MMPESIWPGMFQAEADSGKANVRTIKNRIGDTVASYAISDEQVKRIGLTIPPNALARTRSDCFFDHY
jgi:hypothetical protein